MRRGMLLWMLALLIACLGGAHAYQLAYKDTAGAVRWYQNNIVITGSFTTQPMDQTTDMNGTIKFISSEKVLQVNDDGTATIETEITDGSVTMTFPGLDQPPLTIPMAGFKVSFKRSPTGKVTEMKFEGQPQAIMGMQGMNMADQWKLFSNTGEGFEFPTGDLKAGATWNNDASLELQPGQKMEIKMANVLQGPAQDQAGNLQINSDITMKMPLLIMQIPVGNGQTLSLSQSMDMSMKAVTLFNPIAGEVYGTSMNGTFNMKMTMPMPGSNDTITTVGTMKMTGGMTRIPAQPAPAAK